MNFQKPRKILTIWFYWICGRTLCIPHAKVLLIFLVKQITSARYFRENKLESPFVTDAADAHCSVANNANREGYRTSFEFSIEKEWTKKLDRLFPFNLLFSARCRRKPMKIKVKRQKKRTKDVIKGIGRNSVWFRWCRLPMCLSIRYHIIRLPFYAGKTAVFTLKIDSIHRLAIHLASGLNRTSPGRGTTS